MNLVIIDYGAGNVKSLEFAFQRLGVRMSLSNKVEEIKAADRVIFPGVGQASSAMEKLRMAGLEQVIPKLKQPVLGICLGMQLMCEFSEENNTDGLGIIPTTVKRFAEGVKIPQIGWNQINGLSSGLFQGIPEQTYMYMVHSYYVPNGTFTVATSDYNLPYSAAIQKDNFYGVQFHPEKSSHYGRKLLENFLNI